MSGRYVALGSSMAAGPGIVPRVPGSPRRAGRSERNDPHLVAHALQLDLHDVTYSGATTANLLDEPQHGARPQLEALRGDEELVTITIGGNDIGYVPSLMLAGLPSAVRRLPVLGPWLRQRVQPEPGAMRTLDVALRAVGTAARTRAPHARVLFVDYLTLLPPAGRPAAPLSQADAESGRRLAAQLLELTTAAAAGTGCELLGVADASRDHHAWSAVPWTVGARLPLPARPAPFHPNAAGMAAVAEMVVSRVRSP